MKHLLQVMELMSQAERILCTCKKICEIEEAKSTEDHPASPSLTQQRYFLDLIETAKEPPLHLQDRLDLLKEEPFIHLDLDHMQLA